MSEQNLSLTLGDFENVVKLVDMAASRGAIRGEEMVVLGTLRAKFVAFLEQNGQEQPEPPQDVAEAQDEGDKEYAATEG